MPKYIKKYELTNRKMTLKKGVVLHRIKALRDFASVRRGDLGGWLQSEANLSTDYNLAWISGNAIAYGEARIEGDAWLSGNARVYGNAVLCEQANVEGNAMVYGNATVSDCAKVGENARVFSSAHISGNAKVRGSARVHGEAKVSGEAEISDKAQVCGNAQVYGKSQIFDNAQIYGKAVVKHDARIGGDVMIENSNDYVTIAPIGGGSLTLTRCGMTFSKCFKMTFDELLAECKIKSRPKLYSHQYKQVIRFAIAFFGIGNKEKLATYKTMDSPLQTVHYFTSLLMVLILKLSSSSFLFVFQLVIAL